MNTNPDDTYAFYTRGVDRVAEAFDDPVGSLPNTGSAFDGGEDLWESLQGNLSDFINNPLNGGQAQVVAPTIERIDIADLEAVLNATKPVSDLGCN